MNETKQVNDDIAAKDASNAPARLADRSKERLEAESAPSDSPQIREGGLSEAKLSDNLTHGERAKTVNASPMVKIVESSTLPPEEGDLVEGIVIDIDKSALFVNIPPSRTGIIYGREFLNARDLIKKVSVGDTIAAKVVERENDDGYVELSLREARQALIWSEAEEAIQKKAVFELPVKDANKGGLIFEWQGIQGFLPASQLKPEHYPRVEDADKEKILSELQKLVGEKLSVMILSANPKEGKLIFSEKEQKDEEKGELVEKYSVGDILEGAVTGIVDFGIFLKIEEGLEGLVHISEMDWGLVEDPRAMFKVGEKVQAQIIEIKDGKISLSIKALKKNPWVEASEKYKEGNVVRGVVIKYNKYGALVSIEEGVAGLVHISEFGAEDKLKENLELGKSYSFKITLFDPEKQRMTFVCHEGEAAKEGANSAENEVQSDSAASDNETAKEENGPTETADANADSEKKEG